VEANEAVHGQPFNLHDPEDNPRYLNLTWSTKRGLSRSQTVPGRNSMLVLAAFVVLAAKPQTIQLMHT
jgi:hypothetical protein